ncbi:MAG: Fic/DOC family protein [bacterium ADurb.Bin212]|nr:MAG: Fic/DOC family protein [bacterium ADurb.Bin212]
MNKKDEKMIIYSAPDKGVEIKIKLDHDTIWLTKKQIAELFNVDRTVVSRHINNIYKSEELERKSTCAKIAHVLDKRDRSYESEIYNLDAIISVGYRVNSKKATQFRVWATTTLRKYLIDGYAINQKRLAEQEKKLTEIQKTVALIRAKSDERELVGYEHELLELINEYTKSLVLLNQYDEGALKIGKVNRYVKFQLTEDEYLEAKRKIVELVSKGKRAGELFGREQGNKIKGIIGSINQTFDGKELYDSIEEKAAHLLYFIIKDHPYSDGNKRIGSMLFLYFLRRNGCLYKTNGGVKINDNTIIALALLVAVSDPAEKDSIINLIINIIKE